MLRICGPNRNGGIGAISKSTKPFLNFTEKKTLPYSLEVSFGQGLQCKKKKEKATDKKQQHVFGRKFAGSKNVFSPKYQLRPPHQLQDKSPWPQSTSTQIISLCNTQPRQCRFKNVTAASVKISVGSNCVKLQFLHHLLAARRLQVWFWAFLWGVSMLSLCTFGRIGNYKLSAGVSVRTEGPQ